MIFVSAIVAAGTILFILAPLLGWGVTPAFELTGSATRRDELLRQRQEILAGLKDLDLEYEVGKLTREDYELTRTRLSAQAVEIYREMDQDARS